MKTIDEQRNSLKELAKEAYEILKHYELDTPEGALAERIVETLAECGCYMLSPATLNGLAEIGIFPQ
jgi:hypothetical protein